MKPIVDGKGIIAKLGNKELTREELRRLPKGVKDKVRFYSDTHKERVYTNNKEIDDDLTVSVNSGMVIATLDGKNLTPKEYEELPDDVRDKEVLFNITQLGRNYPNMPLKDRINTLKGGIGWENKKEFADAINIPEDKIGELISNGLAGISKGNYVIDNRDGNALERIEKFLGKSNPDIIKGITEWATTEELSEQLGIPLEDVKKSLDKQIAKGFIEEKDGKFRVNDSDGKGKERIINYLDELGKVMDEKMNFYDAISQMVKGGIYDAIKKGWIEFMDGRTYTADEWKSLNDIERERISIKLTEKGRREIDDNNPLKIYDELAKKKGDEGGLNIVKNITEKDGEFQLELTEEGMKVKQMGIAMGIEPKRIFQVMLNIGLNREMSKFMIVESDKIIDGSRRNILKPKSI